MTVEDLIGELKQLPQDYPIKIYIKLWFGPNPTYYECKFIEAHSDRGMVEINLEET